MAMADTAGEEQHVVSASTPWTPWRALAGLQSERGSQYNGAKGFVVERLGDGRFLFQMVTGPRPWHRLSVKAGNVEHCEGEKSNKVRNNLRVQAVEPPHVTDAAEAERGCVDRMRAVAARASFPLDTWVDLPGRPGCMVRFCQQIPGERSHCFYDFLAERSLRMEFWGSLYEPTIVHIGIIEIISWCPQDYCWPWCVLCGKFLLPVEDHRCSFHHQRMLENIAGMDNAGVRADYGWKIGRRTPFSMATAPREVD